MFQHEELEKYAELVIRKGLNLQPGQTLVIGPEAMPVALETAPFVRHLTAEAYKAGAKRVIVNWEDDVVLRTFLEQAPLEALDNYPTWSVQRMEQIAADGGAFLSVYTPNPTLFQGIDPERVNRYQKGKSKTLVNFHPYTQGMKVNWCIVSIPTPGWAQTVFPGLEADEAMSRLWEQIRSIVRLDQPDLFQAWDDHIEQLGRITETLNQANFRRLRYTAPGTDLTLALPNHHRWLSLAGTKNAQGVPFLPNLPSEETFTAPVKTSVNGTVRSTLPLNYRGTLIENISLTFENGKVVDYRADSGLETLKSLLETDEGSCYLGEAALVPVDSPIAKLGLLFYNTLYDENASCHLAIGSAYPTCVEGGGAMSQEERTAAGLNHSIAHVDFMIGSSELNVDGETETGEWVPILRNGNWAL